MHYLTPCILALFISAINAQPSYYPSGPQMNVLKSNLTGWQLCWSDSYALINSTISGVLSACSGNPLLMACGPAGSDILTLLAAGSRTAVITDIGSSNTPTIDNGVAWYHSTDLSWGFAKSGDVIDRNSCDTEGTSFDADGQATNAGARLCWHTQDGNVGSGWRCGTNHQIASGWTRYLYHFSCTNLPDGTPCDDANACTQTDQCQAGQCVGSNPVTCTAVNQCHDVGMCDPLTGLCSAPMKANGTLCNDQDGCTQVDYCSEGTCIGTDPVTCTALDQCHDVGVCNSATGECSAPLKADNTSCDDEDACTIDDTCTSGVCRGFDTCQTQVSSATLKQVTLYTTGFLASVSMITLVL